MLPIALSEVTVGLASAGATLLAALIGLGVPLLDSRGKLKELRARLDADRLATAREHLDDLYVPLNKAVSQLRRRYRHMGQAPEPAAGGREIPGENEFRTACDEFLAVVDEIDEKGQNILLTGPLDAALQDFSDFLRGSLAATTPRTRILLRIAGAGVSVRDVSGSLFASGAFRTAGRTLAWLTPLAAVEVEEVVAAPPTTRPFAVRFVADTDRITELIRDVSLASATSGSA